MFAYSPSTRDGAGFAVVTDRFVCLLSADATPEIARAVFWLLDGEDARLEDALGRLANVDLVERFAIVETLDSVARSMHVAVRGQVSVGIEGTTATRLSAPGEATWITGEARGVSSLWLSLDEHQPQGQTLPLGRGVVRADAIVADSLGETLFPAAEAAPADAAPAEAATAGPAPAEEPVATASEGTEHPEPVEAAPESAAPTGAPTTLRVDLNEWMNGEGSQRWILRLPDGNELDADGTIVIGRKSWEGDVDEQFIKHVSVPSPKRQISGSHLELALVDGELVARDLDSTNGTIVLTPERPPRLLHGGRTTSLQTGDILDLGESFRIVVSNKH